MKQLRTSVIRSTTAAQSASAILAAAVLSVSGTVLAQHAPAPGAIDGVNIFAATADTTMENIRSDNQAQLAGEPVPTWFGLWAIDGGSGLGRRSYVTFDLTGKSAVQSAQLYLYDYYYEGFMLPGANVSGTATVRGIGGPSFNEPTVGYMQSGISTSSVLRADRTTWNVLGTFTISGSDGSASTPGNEVGWYAVDVTSLWNASVGQKITMSIDFVTNPGGDGPIFEDTQNTAFANGAYGAIANSGPRIMTTAVVPEPASLALLAFAGLMLRMRRR